jgi:hypothetical protein
VAYVSDVRAAAKEQVESLGGRFIDPPELEQKPGETGGYAQQATDAFLAAQRRQLTEQLALADMVICTALVPGRPAPRLISEEMLDRTKTESTQAAIESIKQKYKERRPDTWFIKTRRQGFLQRYNNSSNRFKQVR